MTIQEGAAVLDVIDTEPAKRRRSILGNSKVGDIALRVIAGLVLLYIFVPIFIIILFSFNKPSGKFNYTWQGFTLDNWADPFKYPEDFPAHYEGLGLKQARFRVMGWGPKLAEQWSHHTFDERWELLAPMAETPAQFLQSLDLFVYALRSDACESWGRVVVEAMLTGAVPLVPAGPRYHYTNLIRDGESGFLCADQEEFGHYARLLERDEALRLRMSRRAREWAEFKLCDAAEHLAGWRRLFHGGAG